MPDGHESETAAKPPEQDVIVTLNRFLSEGAELADAMIKATP